MADSADRTDRGRREALKKVVLGAGAVTAFPIIGQPALAAHGPGPAPRADNVAAESSGEWKPLFFDEHQNATVITLTDLIIPQTDTPGAKAALANRYMDLVLNEEHLSRKKTFIEGLAWIDARSFELYGKPFVQVSSEQQVALLTPLANPNNRDPRDHAGVRFFEDLKDRTIFAYYTSKIGLEQELHYGGDEYRDKYPGACSQSEHQT